MEDFRERRGRFEINVEPQKTEHEKSNLVNEYIKVSRILKPESFEQKSDSTKTYVKSLSTKIKVFIAFAVLFFAEGIFLGSQRPATSRPDISPIWPKFDVMQETPVSANVTPSVEAKVFEAKPVIFVLKEQPRFVVLQSQAFTQKKFTNTIGMEFVFIPTGTFTMGSRLNSKELVDWFGREENWIENEQPLHDVNIHQAFYLQTTEVTQEQWIKVMGDNSPYSQRQRKNLPVGDVSWEQVQHFIEQLKQLEKTAGYRLPSEAEWEYACRAGTKTEFFFGDRPIKLREYGWEYQNSQIMKQPTASLKPNPWGLYDMVGNVMEWVEDDWDDNYEGAPINGQAWVCKPRSYFRVARGGSYLNNFRYFRSATRVKMPFNARSSFLGFRLAMTFAHGT